MKKKKQPAKQHAKPKPRPAHEPVPLDEDAYPKKFWSADPCDSVLPPRGFITDSVFYARGREVPTLFTIWSTLWALASAIKREAWIMHGDERLYTNYYTILVGPAGIVSKNTALTQAARSLQGAAEHIKDPQIREAKHYELMSGTFTPEALLEAHLNAKRRRKAFNWMGPDGHVLRHEDGSPHRYNPTSELAVAIYEMATTIGKQEYNKGLIEKLLDLYDPQDRYEWSTVKRGKQILPYTCLTLCALTTAQGFRSSVPPVATSDGFLSRCIIVHQPDTPRCFPEMIVPDGVSIGLLRERLGWIAERAWDEYHLSEQARTYYDAWYRRFHQRLRVDLRYAGIRSRVHKVLVKKVALLLHVQQYHETENHEISLEALKSAERLIERTWQESRGLISYLMDVNMSEEASKIESLIRTRGRVSRKTLLHGAHVKAPEISDSIRQLAAEGRVRILLNGIEQRAPSRDSSELYEWIDAEELEDEGH